MSKFNLLATLTLLFCAQQAYSRLQVAGPDGRPIESPASTIQKSVTGYQQEVEGFTAQLSKFFKLKRL